jgi:hypothetical protein
MDGYDYRARQLPDSSLALIPVISVSGPHDAAVASSPPRVAACIPKPFALDDVLTRVGQLHPGTSVPAARS